MIKLKRDCNILTDAQVESLLMLLNAAYEATGDTNVLKCIGILMDDTNSLILKESNVYSEIESIVNISDLIPEKV